eukprot:3019852-Karenia_brevis.AAC.1
MVHLDDLGGRISPHKSKIFATFASHRSWLSTYVWPSIKQTVEVAHHMRDLGASISSTYVCNTTVSRHRLRSATSTLSRIARLPHTKGKKAEFVVACGHAKALYGCEASHVDESALRTYTSVVMKTLGTANQMHARSLTFAFTGHSLDLDPYIAIFTRRIMMMRRVFIKLPHIRDTVQQIFDLYKQEHYNGVHVDGVDLAALKPAPLPGGDRRADWKAEHIPLGPMGLLLQNLHMLGGTLDFPLFIVRTHRHPNINMLDDPFHHLKPTLLRFAFDAVHSTVAPTRTVLTD